MYYVRILRTVFLEPYAGPAVAEAPRSMRLVHGVLAALIVLNGLYPALLLRLLVPVTDVLAARGMMHEPALPPLTMQWSAAAAIAALGGILAFLVGRQSPVRSGTISVAAMALALASVLLQAGRYDLLSLWFALLIVVVGGLNLTYSIGYMAHEHAPNRYFFAFVVMIGGLLGLVASKDLFNFFAFWELMSSWTLYLVIVHEETEEALNEGYKYFIFNFIGASLLFLGVTVLAAQGHTFQIADLAQAVSSMPRGWLCAAIVLILAGLLMKAAQLPVRIDYQMHPAPAPTPASGYISAVLLKTAPYGVLKFFAAVGAAATFARISGGTAWMPNLMDVVSGVATVTLLYAGAKCMVETGIKRLLIYSTVSQLGYILLGISLGTPLGIAGGLMHAVNHMMLKNTLFLVAGCLISQVHVTSLDELGGLGRRMPVTFGIFLFAGLSVSGIPPLNGFSSKWHDLSGGLPGRPLHAWPGGDDLQPVHARRHPEIRPYGLHGSTFPHLGPHDGGAGGDARADAHPGGLLRRRRRGAGPAAGAGLARAGRAWADRDTRNLVRRRARTASLESCCPDYRFISLGLAGLGLSLPVVAATHDQPHLHRWNRDACRRSDAGPRFFALRNAGSIGQAGFAPIRRS